MIYLLWLIEALAVAAFAKSLGIGWWIWLLYAFALLMEFGVVHKLYRFLDRSPQVQLNCPLEHAPTIRSVP